MFRHLLFVAPVLVLVLAVLSAPALAIGTPAVTLIPDKISKNGAFLVVVDPSQTQNESIIVRWESDAYGGESNFFNKGSFPRVKGKYVCYFSSDNESTCGPPIYKNAGTRIMFINVTNQDGTPAGKSISVPVGNIQVQPTVFINQYGNISIRWPVVTYEPSQLFYKLYFANNFTEAAAGSISSSPSSQGYAIDLAAGPGEYFASFRIDHPTAGFGGSVARIVVPSGLVILQGGQFIPGSLVAAPAAFDVLLNKGDSYQKSNFMITNTGNSSLSNLSVALPAAYSQYMTILPVNSSIPGGGSTYYTVGLSNVQQAMSIITTANITSSNNPNVTLGQIPINATISVIGGGGTCPVCQAGGTAISVSPNTWTGEYVAGTPASASFTIYNTGNSTMTGLNYSSSFSGLTMELPPSIASGSSEVVAANYSSSFASAVTDAITITSSAGSATILMSLRFYDDIGSGIDSLVDDMADAKAGLTASQQAALSSVFADIENDITAAQSAQSTGQYESAKASYSRARAKLDGVSNTIEAGAAPNPTPQGGGFSLPFDTTTLMIIVAVVVAVVVLVIFIRRRRGSGSDVEDELADEFGQIDGGGPPS